MSADSVSVSWSNEEVLEEHEQEQREAREERKQERTELYGKAQEIFQARARDSFTVELHGVEIEFLYPDPDTKQEFENRQRKILEDAQEGASLFDLLQEAQVGLDKMEGTLSDHAVDPSLQDPSVWRSGLGLTEDEVGELYQDFLMVGRGEETSRQAEMLETMLSGTSSSG